MTTDVRTNKQEINIAIHAFYTLVRGQQCLVLARKKTLRTIIRFSTRMWCKEPQRGAGQNNGIFQFKPDLLLLSSSACLAIWNFPALIAMTPMHTNYSYMSKIQCENICHGHNNWTHQGQVVPFKVP